MSGARGPGPGRLAAPPAARAAATEDEAPSESSAGGSQLDPLIRAVRSALHEELGELLAEGGYMRRSLRSEVDAALKSWGCGLAADQVKLARRATRACQQEPEPARAEQAERRVERRASECSASSWRGNPFMASAAVDLFSRRWSRRSEVSQQEPEETRAETAEPKGAESPKGTQVYMATAAANHFSRWVESVGVMGTRSENSGATRSGEVPVLHVMTEQGERFWDWLHNLEEPPRTGCLSSFIVGSVFEVAVCVTILFNFVFMVYVANVEIENPYQTSTLVLLGEWFFQAFYTIEMVMKLIVHRQWFFCNDYWRINMFDLTLVIVGFVALGSKAGSGGALRLLRVLKFGKATGAIRVVAHLKHLRVLLVCLQGSFLSLFWSLFTLGLTYALFSLFLMQIITSHLIETGEALEGSDFYDLFGSVERSMLTLYKASTGGDNWSLAYDVIHVTGKTGKAMFLFFIAFVQFALINIITGIFVESAMSFVKTDSITLAREVVRKEQEDAQRLDGLCRAVDEKATGNLTPEQFKKILRKSNIPMLLKTLGLQTHHLIEFFYYMAEVRNEDGQVEIGAFVDGCMLLKGAATNFDLQKLHAEFKAMQAQHDQNLLDILKLLRDRSSGLERQSLHV